jgi:hypothetical protein
MQQIGCAGIMLFGLESRVQEHKWLDTPQLAISY